MTARRQRSAWRGASITLLAMTAYCMALGLAEAITR
jgi:hypothetical protein